MFARTAERWRLNGLGPWRAFRQVLEGYRRNHLDARSAQYAYYGFLVIPPALILLIRALSKLPWKGLLDGLILGTSDTLPGKIRDLLLGQIQDLRSERSSTLLWMALAVFALASGRLMRTILRGLSSSFEVQETRPLWRRWTVSLALVGGAFLLLVSSLVLMLAGPDLQHVFAQDLHLPALSALLASGTRWILICGLVLLASSLIYWSLPNVHRPWAPLAPESVFASLSWLALSAGFRVYVENFNRFNETYGALGGVILLLAWLYLSGAVLFVGGQIAAVLYHAEASARRPAPAGHVAAETFSAPPPA